MKAMLDTHVWLWYLLGDERLSPRIREIIGDDEVELWLSPVSIWEAHLLIERERLPVTEPPSLWVKKALRLLPVREASLTFAIAVRSRAVSLTHQDPVDRFIAATAPEMSLPLLTVDLWRAGGGLMVQSSG
jgi:PIN domain nuclease of toxin-antitoxin system